MYESQICI